MPEIRDKTLHSFSSEDPQFPASNLLEWKVTKKWKCQEPGEKSCFVVFKLDQPRIISSIDIGNERSGFIEVLVANSKQDPPVFKEILLATSFMTIVEVKNDLNPNRVRFFPKDVLVESVAKCPWDLVKVVCSQPWNNKIKYGVSFVTLHTTEDIKYDDSPDKTVTKAVKVEGSSQKRKNFGNFSLRNSDSDSDGDGKKLDSPFSRWKSSQSSDVSKPTIKEQMLKLEENRKRIRVMADSSDEEAPPKPKSNRNRSSGLVYLDEDDEPNEKLQKKMDKDKESRDKDKKSSKHRDKSPPKSDPNKFSSFVSSDAPSTSSSSLSKSSSKSNRPSSSSASSKHHSPHKSSRRDKENDKKSPRKEKESERKPKLPKNVTYKPFRKLLQGVVFVFSGYVNPERGILRQKAIDMGAKYEPDWDSSCTHLICAFTKTPKYQQVKGVGKIVSKRWIEACFSEQKKLPWRRYALDKDDKDAPESEDEIHNELTKPKSTPTKKKHSDSGSDDDMVVVDKRVKNGDSLKPAEAKPEANSSVVATTSIETESIDLSSPEKQVKETRDVMEVSTDDEATDAPVFDLTLAENTIFKGKTFYLNDDLSAAEIIKLKSYLQSLAGRVTEHASKADYVITESGRRLPSNSKGEVLLNRWIHECHDIGALIPTTRYKPKTLQ